MKPRGNNSLGIITQSFIDWVAKGETVNLNDASMNLGVSKRRLYDVVNVLEGVGLLEKCGVNQVRWRDDCKDSGRSSELSSQCAKLQRLEAELDLCARRLISALKRIEMDDQYAYLRLQDLRSSQFFTDKTLIIVKSSSRRNIRTSFNRPNNSMQGQVKFETTGEATLQGFLSPAGSFMHSNFEQNLFGCVRQNFCSGQALAAGTDVVIKDRPCSSVHLEDYHKSDFSNYVWPLKGEPFDPGYYEQHQHDGNFSHFYGNSMRYPPPSMININGPFGNPGWGIFTTY